MDFRLTSVPQSLTTQQAKLKYFDVGQCALKEVREMLAS